MGPLILHPYQDQLINEAREAFRSSRRVLVVSPTGSGKTVLFSHVGARAAQQGLRVCFLGHKQEIVDQIASALTCIGIPHGLIAARAEGQSSSVQVASVPTMARRLDSIGPFDLIVLDETHHAVAGSWSKILAAHPGAWVLGVTATPERLDGRGLGDVFGRLVIGPSIAELTAGGFLVPAICYGASEEIDLSAVHTRAGDFDANDLHQIMAATPLIGNAVEHYRRICEGAPAIAFCCSLEHSRMVAARFVAAGIRAAHVDGHVPWEERRRLIRGLGTGEIEVLCNAGLISEGVDVPAVGAVILLRPTQSLALYLQQVGRALRPAPGKSRAVILDHAGNIWRHGLPDAPREWSLAGRPRKPREHGREGDHRLHECPGCTALRSSQSLTCHACGTPFSAPKAEPIELEADLVELNARVMLKDRPIPQLKTCSSQRAA